MWLGAIPMMSDPTPANAEVRIIEVRRPRVSAIRPKKNPPMGRARNPMKKTHHVFWKAWAASVEAKKLAAKNAANVP